MKKLMHFVLVVAISLTVGLVACERQQVKEDPNLLSDDENFVQLVTETQEFMMFLATEIQAKSLPKSTLIESLMELEALNLCFDQQMTSIDKIFQGNVSVHLKSYMETFRKNWQQLLRNYGQIDPTILSIETEEVFLEIALNANNGYDVALGEDCSWRYFFCAAAATSAAMLCHGACSGSAIAVTAGLGIPACIILCASIQVYMFIQCEVAHC
jgi:hypothetical protein